MTHSPPYEILELPADATLDQVKAAYRRLAPQVHPDLGGSQERFRHVRGAYVTITQELTVTKPRFLHTRRSPPAHRASARAGRSPVRDQRTKWVKALLAQERAVSPRVCVTA